MGRRDHAARIVIAVPLDPGTRIGRFEITGLLGSGGMGEVYQAWDLKLQREVAVKLLSPVLAGSEDHLRRFEREARAASALNHPNICTIYDIGQDPGTGRPYLVMELLRGTTLAEMLESGALPVPAVVAIGAQIADALDAAHGAGIVHRDLKPANIFITGRGDVKLLDFGIASVAREIGSPQTQPLTGTGTTFGTVVYMSPEQALGEPVDYRTDLFSFGLVLYEMLTGHRPFEGPTMPAIVDGILHATPPGLERGARSNIPRDLRTILSRTLDKDRTKRPKSASEIAAFLRALQSGSIAGREFAAVQPSQTEAPGTDSLRIRTDVLRNAPPYKPLSSTFFNVPIPAFTMRDAVALGLLLLALAAAWGGRVWYTRLHPPVASREPLLLADFTNSTGEAVFDGALREALEIQLQQSPYLNVLSQAQVRSALAMTDRPPDARVTPAIARDLCQRLGVKAILLGSIVRLGASYVIGLEAQACRTGDVFDREQVEATSHGDVLASVGAAAARLRRRLGESLGSIQRFNVPIQNATTGSLDALKAYSTGMQMRARVGDAQAIPLFEHALELDPRFALAAERLGAIYENLHDRPRAQEYLKRAFALSEGLSEPERLAIRSVYHFIVSGELDTAIGVNRLWASQYPHDWVPHSNASATHYRLNQFDDALREAREAVRLAPDQVVPYQQLAQTELVMGLFDECRRTLQTALDRGLDSTFNRALLFDLAFLDGNRGEMEQQIDAAAARTDGYLVLVEAARAAAATGDMARSRSLYAQAIARASSEGIGDYVGSLTAEQAIQAAVTGDRAAALPLIAKADAMSSGPDTTWNLALANAFAGRPAAARQLADRYLQASSPAPDIVAGTGPILQAAAALASGEPQRALTLLAPATRYAHTTGGWLPYLRGRALTALHQPGNAVIEFRSLIDLRGVEPAGILHPLARLELARAAAAVGDVTVASDAYHAFIAAWSGGSERHPLADEAAREAAALMRAGDRAPGP
jgi:serine/threonine protein kinase/tetratricopeptide (TPR) repeat protein